MRCNKILGVVTLCSMICVGFSTLICADRGSLGRSGMGGGRGGGGGGQMNRSAGQMNRGGGQMNRSAARPNYGGGARPGLSSVGGQRPQMGASPNIQGRPSLGGGFGQASARPGM